MASTNDIELSVVILCYKSGKQAYGFVEKTMELLKKSVPSWELILVGNYMEGTDDDTPDVVKDISLSYDNVRAVTLPKQGMMGWDAITGMNKAGGRFICFIDGDEQMPQEDIIRVYKKIKSEDLDLVKTYRTKRGDSIKRLIISHVYNWIFGIVFPSARLRDINSKPKIFTRDAYKRMRLTSKDWFLDAEIVLKSRKLRLKIQEIPTEFYRCSYRKSFVRFSAIFEFIRNIFYTRIKF